jgi:hypothetical protein
MLGFDKDGYAFYATGWETLDCNDTLTINVTLEHSCNYVIGDINGNGIANGVDVVFAISFFRGGNTPPIDCGSPVGPCPQNSPFYAAGDVSGNCTFNGMDVTFLANYLMGVKRFARLRYCPSCVPDNSD